MARIWARQSGEKSRGLAGRYQAVVLQHVERQGPVLVGVKHDAPAGNAVNRSMDALRRKFDEAFALERVPGFVENDQVAGARLRPVQSER